MQHLQEDRFQPFRIDELPRRTVETVIRAVGQVGGTIQKFLVNTASGIAGPMAHQAGGGNAADVAELLNEHGFCALPPSADGGGDTGRACAENEYIYAGGYRKFFCRFFIKHEKNSFA